MTTDSCDGCVHKFGNECRLMPPTPVTVKEWVDSGHPMLPEYQVQTTKWVFAPATHRCGQFDDKEKP